MSEFPDCACSEQMLEEQENDRDDLVVRVCRDCGRRHFEVAVEPLHVGVKPSGGVRPKEGAV